MKSKSVAINKMGIEAKVVDGKLVFTVEKGKLGDGEKILAGFAKIANEIRDVVGDKMSSQKYTSHSVTKLNDEEGKDSFVVEIG